MAIRVLRDILISANQIDRYFEGSVPVHLWRAMKVKSNAHPFEFIEQPITLSNGRPRAADIKIEIVNGEKWVCVKDRPRGLSTFDKPGVPTGKDWKYFKIAKGTMLPHGLAIVRDEFNSTHKATHYTIAPAFDMPLVRFKTLLNQLASSLMREAI